MTTCAGTADGFGQKIQRLQGGVQIAPRLSQRFGNGVGHRAAHILRIQAAGPFAGGVHGAHNAHGGARQPEHARHKPAAVSLHGGPDQHRQKNQVIYQSKRDIVHYFSKTSAFAPVNTSVLSLSSTASGLVSYCCSHFCTPS